MSDTIKVDWQNDTCTITFNRDAKRNAFSTEMSNAVLSAINEADHRGCPVVLTANPGTSVWSAGHDLSEIHNPSDLAEDTMFDLMKRIMSCDVPVVCVVDGDVYAGGFLITLVSDIVLATERSRFCMTINKMGIPLPRYLYQYAVSVMGLHKTKELFFCASLITSTDAYHAGLVNHVAEDGDALQKKVGDVLSGFKNCLPEGLAFTKHELNFLTQDVMLDSDASKLASARYDKLLSSGAVASRIEALAKKIGAKA